MEVFIFHFFSFGQFCQGDSSLFNDASMGMVQVITSFYTTHHQNKGRNKIQTQNTKYKSMGMVQVLRLLYKTQNEGRTKVHDLLSKETDMPRS